MKLLNAPSALEIIKSKTCALIDVRSEGEYAQGMVGGFVNAPILVDEERHRVGIEYKLAGQQAAIELGTELTRAAMPERIERWRQLTMASKDQAALVMCWRGGLRSQLACEQLTARGCEAVRVNGGYKALRAELMGVFLQLPPLLILSGLTGSGKTRLLASLPIAQTLDLEGIAKHRGSSFGGRFDAPQPSQASFENEVAMSLKWAVRPVMVEDESAAIGRVYLPMTLVKKMQESDTIVLEAALEERVQNLFEEYVAAPLAAGVQPEVLAEALAAGILKLKRRLGGALTADVAGGVADAFAAQRYALADHAPWISRLLTDYYDRAYRHAFERAERRVVFQGTFAQVREWVLGKHLA